MNNYGTISKDELYEAYKQIYAGQMTDAEIRQETDNVMSRIDIDGSGLVDYTEWAIGTSDKHKILTDTKLKKAFQLFDKVRSFT